MIIYTDDNVYRINVNRVVSPPMSVQGRLKQRDNGAHSLLAALEVAKEQLA